MKLLDKKLKSEDILTDLKDLINQRYPNHSDEYKTFVEEMAACYISAFNPQVILDKKIIYSKPSEHNEIEQMKAIIPIYKKYIESQSYSAAFLTSLKVAQILNIPEVQAQQWESGNYPYGQSGNIALVIKKRNTT